MSRGWRGQQGGVEGWASRLVALVAIGALAVGCGEVGDSADEPGGEQLDEQVEPLFVDFQRIYEPPEGDYFGIDGVTTVNPDGDALPLVIDEDVQKFSTHALEHARVDDDLLEFPRRGFGQLEELQPGDLVISELRRAEFWRQVESVERTDDAIVVRTVDAEFPQVVEMGDFYINVQPGYQIPDDFDLLDPYLDEGIHQYRQALSVDCMEDHFDYDEAEGSEWYQDHAADWMSDKHDPHADWLDQRADEVHDDHSHLFINAKYGDCTSASQWDISEAQSDYYNSSGYQDYLDELDDLEDDDPVPSSPPDPPSVVCLEDYLLDQFAEDAVDSYETQAADAPTDEDELVAQTCEYLDASEEDAAFDDEVDFEEGKQHVSSWLLSLITDFLFPSDVFAEFADEPLVPDPHCKGVCEDDPMEVLDDDEVDPGASDAELVDECLDDCPKFRPCVSDDPVSIFASAADALSDDEAEDETSECGEESDDDDDGLADNLVPTPDVEVCAQLYHAHASYQPEFEFGYSLNPLDPEIWVEVDGPMELELGLKTVITGSLNWSFVRDHKVPIPSLAFSLGPLSFGAQLYAEFGISTSVFGSTGIDTYYERAYDVGARAGFPMGAEPPGRGSYLEETHDEFEYSIGGHKGGTNLGIWLAGGIGLYGVDIEALQMVTDGIQCPQELADAGFDDFTTRYLGLDVLRGQFTAEAVVAPPDCTYDIGFYLATILHWNFDIGIVSPSGNTFFYGPDYLWRQQGSLTDVVSSDYLNALCPGDDGTMPDPPEFEEVPPGCNDDDADCDDGETCAGGQRCVRNEGLRMTLDWGPAIDLSLVVQAPDGQIHTVAGGIEEHFTVWNCGGMCGDDYVQERYIENVIFDDPDPGEYQFHVIENDATPTDVDGDSVNYDLEVELEGEPPRSVSGSVQRDRDEPPVSYSYCVPDEDGEGCDEEEP